jgi:NTP pyrophosphatase (non-canonical NTP hydrolase)
MKLGKALKQFHNKFHIEGSFRNLKWEELHREECSEAAALRFLLIKEEFQELMAAIKASEVDILNKQKQADVLKELCDVVYVLAGFAEKFGWDIDEALERVHASNMSKVDDKGKPIYRDDGKLMKGPNYKPPILLDLVGYVEETKDVSELSKKLPINDDAPVGENKD